MNLPIYSLEEILFGPANPEFTRAVLPELPRIGADRPLRVITCDRIQNDADVRNAARHWAGMIERLRERHNTFDAHEAECGLQPYNSAQSRRNAYRTAGVRTCGGGAEPHRLWGCGASA